MLKIGDIINGYRIVTQHEDRVVLAVAVDSQNGDKAVVWYLDYQGKTHTGNYYTDIRAAQAEFMQRAFRRWCM